MPDTVMIVTGETSGELYGSLLALSLKKKHPSVKIIGIGGDRMKAAGVELVAGISSAFGIAEVFSSMKALRKTFRLAKETLERHKPAVLVLIDYPDFNLHLSAEAKKMNIPILYYVSPQVWAWRKKRVKKIVQLVDKMAVILPFEEAIYKEAGLDCEFVGHPICDEIRESISGNADMKKELGLQLDRPVLSLLPGSRPHELMRLLPLIEEVICDAAQEFSHLQFCVPLAPNTDLSLYRSSISRLRQMGVFISQGMSLKTLAVSDYAVIASGTASLQAVFLGTPTVVIYKLFPLTYLLGKLIVKVKHISLVNILSGREVVRELIQSAANAHNIMNEIRHMIKNKEYCDRMLVSFEEVKKMFSGKKASDRVADMVMQMAGWQV